jgi:ubiquinone/menaquinone biosynthesis C-methylase UbiE
MKDYEKIANTVIKDIYPYLITDLKTYYNHTLNNKVIAELGTGPGFIIEELVKENFKYIYGIDISLEMLIKAKKRNNHKNNIQFINANVERIPLKDKSLDIIISRGSIFFWKNIEEALKESFRILKDNGFMLVGGGYGISTPENIIDNILINFKKSVLKNEKPKLNIDEIVKIMNKIGGKTEVISKPKHGFWITWKK